jgi:hypothetical protein
MEGLEHFTFKYLHHPSLPAKRSNPELALFFNWIAAPACAKPKRLRLGVGRSAFGLLAMTKMHTIKAKTL